ncbi:MAG: hypothetical protein AB4352_28070, partial [Hormoscilla sp.]
MSYYLLKSSFEQEILLRSKPRQGAIAGDIARISTASGTFFAFFQKNFSGSNPYPESISEFGEKKLPKKLEIGV